MKVESIGKGREGGRREGYICMEGCGIRDWGDRRCVCVCVLRNIIERRGEGRGRKKEERKEERRTQKGGAIKEEESQKVG